MNDEERALKRQKVSNGDISHTRSRPRIFAPYRTIGLVSPTAVPFTSIAVGKTTFQLTTSVGHSLQTYDLRKGLHLNFLTRPETPEVITASTAWKDKVVAAWGADGPNSLRGVWEYKRGKKVADFELPEKLNENITCLCVFGSWILGLCQTRVLVWKAESHELYTELTGFSPVPFSGAIAALPTFLNKILIGRQDGTAEIWNISSGKLVYTILPPSTTFGAVTAIEPTPALSLAAIAYANGAILIHDIQADHTIILLDAGEGTPATSITFRTDGIGAGDDGQAAGVMATASATTGDITFWDLNNGGRRAGVLRAAHLHPTSTVQGGVSKIQFLPGQAILVSSGLDNSLKTWIFDETPFSSVPRLLHQRAGHGAAITNLHFLPTGADGSDDTGKWLISGSEDRSLWGWSLRRDAQSSELSQGAVQRKARKQGLLSTGYQDAYRDMKSPPVKSIACSLNRDGGIGALPGKQPIWQNVRSKGHDAEVSAMTGWESLVTAHEADSSARTWFWGRRRAGRWTLPTADGGYAAAVTMSPCGTFALVGSETGSIDMFNLQSGQHRQHFPARLTPMQAKQFKLDVVKHSLKEETDGKRTFLRGQGRHRSAVVGLAVDETNKTVVSAGADGKVKFWDFRSGLLAHELDWSLTTRISTLVLHRGANLAALVCTNGCIRVVDVTTHRLIRELHISRNPVDGLQAERLSNCVISGDARWVVASCAQLVLVWDLSTGHLIDAFKLRGHCKSLDMSPTGEFLAVATGSNVGIEVWNNKSLFSYTPARRLDQEDLVRIVQGTVQAPSVGGDPTQADQVFADEVSFDETDTGEDVDELVTDMLSLSMVPRSRWQNLLNLDLIRQRNKPTEPAKKPEKAPFFLPSLQTQQAAKSISSTTAQSGNSVNEKQLLSRRTNGSTSESTRLLASAGSSHDFAHFISHFKGLTPSSADIEIRSLSAMHDELATFVLALTWLARQRKDFELGQTWMAVFLRVHGDVVRNDEQLKLAVREWAEESMRESQRVQRLAEYCGGLVGYLRAARV